MRMVGRVLRTTVVAVAVGLGVGAASGGPLGTGFTYQGVLRLSGAPVNGTANMVFSVYDAAAGGSLVGTQTMNGVAISSGVFTVQLNAGGELGASVFTGQDRWLEVTVNGQILTPRQKLTAAPYALFSAAPWVTSGISVYYMGSVGVNVAPQAPLHAQGTAIDSRGAVYGVQTGGTVGGAGVYGKSNLSNGNGVVGEALGVSAYGVYGTTDAGVGVYGKSTTGYGGYFNGKGYFSGSVGIGTVPQAPLHVVGTPPGNSGVLRVTQTGSPASWAAAIWAESSTDTAIVGRATAAGSWGVYGSGAASGVEGESTNGHGTTGYSTNGNGVVGDTSNASAYGVYSYGRLGASGTKSLRIDHPLDPENKYLLHYCAEGPEPMNVYSGTAALDGAGNASVALPDYFGEINRDPRIQLTAYGAPMPGLYVAGNVKDNQFQIAGGVAHGQVFWRVEAVRNDRWMQAYGAPVEMAKPAAERGTYQHPELYGQGADAMSPSRPQPCKLPPPAVDAAPEQPAGTDKPMGR